MASFKDAFGLLQKIGKSLMLPVSVLPVAGILLGVGSAKFSWLPEIVSQAMAQSGDAIFGNLALIFANRSASLTTLQLLRHANRAMWWILGGALAALLATLYVPPVARLFRFAPPPAAEILLALAAGFLSVAWYDLYKRRPRARTNPAR